MGEVVIRHPRAVTAEAPGKPASKAEQIAAGLRRVNERLIAPRLRLRETLKGDWHTRASCIAGSDPAQADPFLRDEPWAARWRDDVRFNLSRMPTLDALRSLHEFVEGTFRQPADNAQNRLLIGLMVDSFPNARPHSPETYFEALAHQVGASGYAPVAVACALREIVRVKTFVPSIAEVVEACEWEAISERADARTLATAIQAREWLEAAAPLVAAYDAGERWTPPARPAPEPWKDGDPIPFGDDEPSRRAEIARDIRQLAQRLGARVR